MTGDPGSIVVDAVCACDDSESGEHGITSVGCDDDESVSTGNAEMIVVAVGDRKDDKSAIIGDIGIMVVDAIRACDDDESSMTGDFGTTAKDATPGSNNDFPFFGGGG